VLCQHSFSWLFFSYSLLLHSRNSNTASTDGKGCKRLSGCAAIALRVVVAQWPNAPVSCDISPSSSPPPPFSRDAYHGRPEFKVMWICRDLVPCCIMLCSVTRWRDEHALPYQCGHKHKFCACSLAGPSRETNAKW
jgi:hypothetical protein